MKMKHALLILFWVAAGCAGAPPVEDYTIARTALEAARAFEAPRYAPGYYNAAEEVYRRAQKLYSDRYYEEAKVQFKSATELAEKAENATRYKRYQSGEAGP